MLIKRSNSRWATRLFLLCLSLFWWSGQALADAALESVFSLTPDLNNGKKLYQLCAACHGHVGFGELEGEFPSIAGQHQRVMVKQLLDIQTKKRINPTMYPFVDAETLGGHQGLADVSAYVAGLALNPSPIKGPGQGVDKGKALYDASCVVCHGANGEGQAEALYPRLQGQHYPYLIREMTWIRDKVRKNGNPVMVEMLQAYSEDDIAAVADYITTLTP